VNQHPYTSAPSPLDKLFNQIGSGTQFPSLFDTHVLDSLLSRLGSNKSYPPYDIVSNVDEKMEVYEMTVKMALAGFDKEDINIEVKSNILTIASVGKTEDKQEYIHKGISKRAFETKFKLSRHAVVKSAAMENGMLEVTIEFILPADEKSSKISIK
jgi:molecular chaperone IbpA